MMVFITHCWKNVPHRLLLVLAFVLCAAFPSWAQERSLIDQLRVEKQSDGLYLSAHMDFALGPALQDALTKGVPLHFVAQAELLRDRWYWYDKSILQARRSMRLSYAPLTRRWRVAVVAGTVSESAGVNLNLNFNSQEEALNAIRYIGRWKIANSENQDDDERYNVDYRFYLDLSKLPRPFQIGVDAQSDWRIDALRNVRPVVVESAGR